MKKKVVSLLLVGVLTMSAFVGCGSKKSDAPKKEAEQTEDGTAAMYAAKDKNTLVAAAWDKNFNIPALKAAEAAYQKEHPEFKLEIIEQPDSKAVENAITTAGQSKNYENLPDIVLFQDHYFQQYVTNYPDAWTDSSDAKVDWSDFGEEKLSFSTIDGKHYGYPVDNGTVVMAYRTDLLQEAGYTVDDMTGISWDKFIEVGEKVYEKTGKYLLSMDGDGNDLPYMMLQAEGKSQFKSGKANLADNKELEEILDVINRMQEKNVLLLANDWSGYTNDIQKDKVAGVMNGNWIIPTIEQVKENSGKWAITSMPTLKGGEGFASNGGSSLYITSNSKNVELAKDFLAYTFGGGKGAIDTYDAALRDGGVITTCISAGKSDVYAEGVEYFGGQSVYAKIVEMGSHVKVVEQSDYHYTAREKVAAAITNIKNGQSIKDAIAQAQQDLEFAMEE